MEDSDVDRLTLVLGVILASIVIAYVSYRFGLISMLLTWIQAIGQEKVNFTRLKEYFNGNGYIVHSDSDIQIGPSGSFKRFDSVDKDIKIATSNFGGGGGGGVVDGNGSDSEADAIPPQPLRPAPAAPLPSSQTAESQSQLSLIETVFFRRESASKSSTSIKPLPRPVLSANFLATRRCIAYGSPPPIAGPGGGGGWESSPQPPPPHPPPPSSPPVDASGSNETIAILDRLQAESTLLNMALAVDAEEPDTSSPRTHHVSGHLCISLEYDNERSEMIANILEAHDLVNPFGLCEPVNSCIKIFLLPDVSISVQTKVCEDSSNPTYKERVVFSMDPGNSIYTALLFQIYTVNVYSDSLIGEGELSLLDFNIKQPSTTWVTITDCGQETGYGELMISLSYLPTAERLTVVIIKGRNFSFCNSIKTGNSFVKLSITQTGNRIHKQKTPVKYGEHSPIFNELMIFHLPIYSLQGIKLDFTIAEASGSGEKVCTIGHVSIGPETYGRSLNHWNQMLASMRKPIAMWHSVSNP
ncbi:PREDICTED: synaptotagmin-5 [Nicrophorus vespilloides]|uniref:Synaptotagmin-5 n=1 Tax=Nicrophorus vespilloides TaxID=110193 RepID=A0ABM1M5H3_NICVS|nr:PREDICTED: synaptotagmin-5 [Nicrophorus vespilloides]